MEQRYHHQLFKSDLHFEPGTTLSSPNSRGSCNFGSANQSTPTPKQSGVPEWNQQVPKWKQILGEDVPSSSKSSSQSALVLQNNQQSAVCQLSAILNSATSLRLKCEQISRMVTTFSSKDLIEVYPQLLVEIFAFSGSQVFGINKLEPRKHGSDFSAAFNFLSTSGCLFKIINKLIVDQDAEFHFPYQGLPAGLVEKIKNGQISLWYQNKLMVLPGNDVVIVCNALEYYLLLFAYFIIHPTTLQQPSQWSSVEDILYVRLLEDYLNYFFPIDEVKQQSSPISPEKKLDGTSNLWKSSPVSLSEYPVQTAPLVYIQPSAHAEIFLQLLCDIWLGLNPEHQTDQEQEYKLPSVDHARVVRILVKYLHVFVNGVDSVQTVLYSFTHTEQLEELKSVVIPALLHKPLYIYLQHCFTHWPLDGSFRMILETWLSFIQPWRYRENYTKTANESTTDVDVTSWKRFIGDNMLFYSSMFQMFLLRALRFDLSSFHDVQLVYRVAKVFSQSSLMDILQEELDPDFPAQINVRSPSGPMFLGLMSSTRKAQLEKPTQIVAPIFGQEVTKHVQDLCQLMASAALNIRKKSGVESSVKKSAGILTAIKEFFLIDDTTDLDRDREKQRIMEYLEQTCTLLTETFKLPDVQTKPASNNDNNTDDNLNVSGTTISSDDTLPEFILSENGIELTNLGRYQILQGMRQFPLSYSGDPELQPLRTYESEIAVKAFYWLAGKLNAKYGSALEQIYNRPGFLSKLLRRFSKRLHVTHYMNTPFSLPQTTLTPNEKVAPRISLRFAGSYYFLGYACWVVIIARLVGFSWIFILLAALIFGLVSTLAHVDQPPKKFS